MNFLGNKLRQLREDESLLLREVAASLSVDTAYISKIELGDRKPKRGQIKNFAQLYNCDSNELDKLWLADRIVEKIIDEPFGLDALRFVEKNINQLH